MSEEQIRAEINKMHEMQGQILSAIKGDEFGNKGILPTLSNHDLQIHSILTHIEHCVKFKGAQAKIEKDIEKNIVKKYKLTKRDAKVGGIAAAVISFLIYIPDIIDFISKIYANK
jgi:hypothetical protein